MSDESIELIETPQPCEETTEYDNRIVDEVEIEPEDEEQDDPDSHRNWEEVEQQFARYERNYRARRIRELTLAPLKKRKSGRISQPATEVAA
jgi:hypothetical protein